MKTIMSNFNRFNSCLYKLLLATTLMVGSHLACADSCQWDHGGALQEVGYSIEPGNIMSDDYYYIQNMSTGMHGNLQQIPLNNKTPASCGDKLSLYSAQDTSKSPSLASGSDITLDASHNPADGWYISEVCTYWVLTGDNCTVSWKKV